MKSSSRLGIILVAVLLMTLPLLVICDENDNEESSPLAQPWEMSTSVSQLDMGLIDILGRVSNIRSLTCEVIHRVPVIGSMKTEICLKGDKMRQELMPGVIIIQDYTAGLHYVCDLQKNIAYKSNLEAEDRIPVVPCELENSIMACDPSTVRSETLKNKSCLLLTYSDIEGNCLRTWLSSDQVYPLRIEETDRNNVLISVYHRFDVNPDLSDGLFEIPVDCHIVER